MTTAESAQLGSITRSGGVWHHHSIKLVGTGKVGTSLQGLSVALSADGNTAVVGGPGDNSNTGAVWVFTRSHHNSRDVRSNNVWIQQGNKLVGSGAAGKIGPFGNAMQGYSVALSADGNTAIVGGINDNNGVGAAWIFTRSNGAWTQQGNKLVGTGASDAAYQGGSVALSADGNTAIIGGGNDGFSHGAAWIFTRTGSVWTQQGSKLVGTGAIGFSNQGKSVSLSADGNTAIVGGASDNNGTGAAWIFTRNGEV